MCNAVTRSYADFNHFGQFDKVVYLIANEHKYVIYFIQKAVLKRKRANVHVVIETHVFLLYIFSNLQPYDWYDLFRVTYKPCFAEWLCTV